MTEIQKTDFLHALYIAAIVAAELMGSKIFSWQGFNASVAIFVLPLTFSINDIIFEVYGKKRALSFVRSGLYILFFLVAFNILALVLPPASRFLDTHDAYQLIFSKSLRITVASLLAFWTAERLDVYIFSKLKEKFKQHKFWVRNNLSNLFSLLVDTIVFMFLAFYEPGNFGFILSLVWPYWLLKFSFSAFGTPLTSWGVKWLQKKSSE